MPLDVPAPGADPSSAAPRWIVLKFGGTSVSERSRWDTIGRLMRERAHGESARVLTVVSALSGITNQLQALIDASDLATLTTFLGRFDYAVAMLLDGASEEAFTDWHSNP